MRDPWYFQRWAYAQKLGNPTRKLILGALSTMAESNTGYCFAPQDDLAGYAECSTRTVSEHLKVLEAADLIRRRKRFSPAGRRLADGFLLLAPGIEEWPNGEAVDRSESPPENPASGDPAQSPPEAQASEQERPSGTTTNSTTAAREGEGEKEELPEDFPAELRPHLVGVYRVLRDIAARTRNAKAISAYGLARVVMMRDRKPLLRAAHDYAAWAEGKRMPHRDVVSGYRNWLDKCEDLASLERLPGEDATDAAAGAANVHPIRPRGGGGRLSNAEQVQANIEMLREAERRLTAESSDTVGRTNEA